MSEKRSRGDACLEDCIEVVACEDAVCEDLRSPLLWESMKALIADPVPSLLVSTDSEPIKAALEYVAFHFRPANFKLIIICYNAVVALQ